MWQLPPGESVRPLTTDLAVLWRYKGGNAHLGSVPVRRGDALGEGPV